MTQSSTVMTQVDDSRGSCTFMMFIYFQLDRTALHWAAANGNLRVMELLIHAGADIEAQDKVKKKKKMHEIITIESCSYTEKYYIKL